MDNTKSEAQQTPSRHPATASALGTEMALYAVPLVTLLALRLLLPATICDDAYISFKVADNLASGFGGAIYIKDGDTNTLGYATKAHSQGQAHKQRAMMHAVDSMHHPLHSDSFNDMHVLHLHTLTLLTINLTQ